MLLIGGVAAAAPSPARAQGPPLVDPVVEEPIRPIGTPVSNPADPTPPACGRLGWMGLAMLGMLAAMPRVVRSGPTCRGRD
jgi:hypothetical protein